MAVAALAADRRAERRADRGADRGTDRDRGADHGAGPRGWQAFAAGCVVGSVVAALAAVGLAAPARGAADRATGTAAIGAADSPGAATDPGRPGEPLSPRPDADRLVGVLAQWLDSGVVAGVDSGSLRHRYRLLSWHLLAPLEGAPAGPFVAGQVVITEDSDDDVASTIVYRFAADGTVVATAPTGALLGTIDPTSPAIRAALRAATARRLVVSGG